MNRRTQLWNLAADWADEEDEYPHTLILGYSLQFLFLYHVYHELVRISPYR